MALNRTVVVLVDHISHEISDVAKQAKDLGSFAVFCLLSANGIDACNVINSAIV